MNIMCNINEFRSFPDGFKGLISVLVLGFQP